MEFNAEQPIYLQIADWVYNKILRGEWQEESRIPSVRELGQKLAVNPHTVLKAYDKLQLEKIIYNKRGIGYFTAAESAQKIKSERRLHFINEELPTIYDQMTTLDITVNELTDKLEQLSK